jgi:sterol desaturase/sphingolipid hydroxylase (fatty acid hydroxylase superfamily)
MDAATSILVSAGLIVAAALIAGRTRGRQPSAYQLARRSRRTSHSPRHAAMASVLRWIVGPIVVGGSFLYMAVTGIALGVQENCEPDCVTDAEYATAKWVFWIAFGVWAASLLVGSSCLASRRLSYSV